MKKSGYQKLKDKYLQAKQDINTLVLKPESMEAQRIRFNVNLKNELTNAALLGSRTKVEQCIPGITTPKHIIEAFTQ